MSTYLSFPTSTAHASTDHSSLDAHRATRSDQPAPQSNVGDRAADRDRPIIVFCHLAWDWVWQRPQQFISRLSATHRVLFVEWGEEDVAKPCARTRPAAGYPNITILHGVLPRARRDDDRFIERARYDLVQHVLVNEFPGEFENPILWFYDPMVFPSFAGRCKESAIVYDCMDELSQFHGAPPELATRERELVLAADVVFCGGRRMREKRLPLNPNCHFFGTGVDCQHFGQALSPALPVAPDIARLQHPVLGFFGVVDERMDYELLAKLADARNDWSIAIVGPFAKVDPATFPRRPNLHFLGGRNYADLPAITKGFAACLMPFALNAATEYINPTKALEYMASGKAVISTALREVKSNFASVALIADSHEQFIRYCLREMLSPSRHRIAKGLALASQNTWEKILTRMETLMTEAISRREQGVRHPATASVLSPLNASFSRV